MGEEASWKTVSQEINSYDDFFEFIPKAWEELSSETKEIEVAIPAVVRAMKPVTLILRICEAYKYVEGSYRFERFVSCVIAEFTQYAEQGCVSTRDIAKLITFSKYSVGYLEEVKDTIEGGQEMLDQFKQIISTFNNFNIQNELLAELNCRLSRP